MSMDEVRRMKESLPNGHKEFPLKEEVTMEEEREPDKTSHIANHLGIHVEVCQKQFSRAEAPAISARVKHVLAQNSSMFNCDTIVNRFDDIFLQSHVESISICDSDLPDMDKKSFDLSTTNFHVHVYRLHDDGPAEEELEDEELSAASHWLLPCTEFHGLWESLIYDSHIKTQLLQYVSTTLLFSDQHVDANIISWNRVILLHGPPGTGKTSLCRALAQKLCIQLSDRYQYGQLVEINTHSLFSKWFSESGKLVMKMFQRLQELIDDKDSLVCVLIDEVESLSAARKASLSSSEPSDAIRVVNALLTQLDQIKKYPNVIILTTSNITGAIDLAFVDRADIKQYIGPPSPAAIYKIYQSCLQELMKTGIVRPKQTLLDLRELETQLTLPYVPADTFSVRLKQIAIKSEGLSGRTLRKLPFIAHALYIQSERVTLAHFLDALEKAVTKQFQERDDLSKD